MRRVRIVNRALGIAAGIACAGQLARLPNAEPAPGVLLDPLNHDFLALKWPSALVALIER